MGIKLMEVCLLKEGDKVYLHGRKKATVTGTAKNDTIMVGGEYRYFSEISKEKCVSVKNEVKFKGFAD